MASGVFTDDPAEWCCTRLADKSVRPRHALFAGGAAGGFEAIHLRFALAADAAICSPSVLFLAGTIVESGVGIDPDFDGGVSLKMDYRGGGSLGYTQRYQRSFPGA